MALLQCKTFLAQHPNMKQVDDIDTATVAKRISQEQSEGLAAIASEIAAEIYGLEILARDIQTVKSNFTRFILLANKINPSDEGSNKASFKVTIKNEQGGLAQLLSMLAYKGLDLSKIQSIPVIEKPWEYSFFIDAVFTNYENYRDAMILIQRDFGDVKIFGEYRSRK